MDSVPCLEELGPDHAGSPICWLVSFDVLSFEGVLKHAEAQARSQSRLEASWKLAKQMHTGLS